MLAGKDDVHKLTREDLRALTVDVSAITGVKLVGLEKSVNFYEFQQIMHEKTQKVKIREK